MAEPTAEQIREATQWMRDWVAQSQKPVSSPHPWNDRFMVILAAAESAAADRERAAVCPQCKAVLDVSLRDGDEFLIAHCTRPCGYCVAFVNPFGNVMHKIKAKAADTMAAAPDAGPEGEQ